VDGQFQQCSIALSPSKEKWRKYSWELPLERKDIPVVVKEAKWK
jgi:hypothetical protein